MKLSWGRGWLPEAEKWGKKGGMRLNQKKKI